MSSFMEGTVRRGGALSTTLVAASQGAFEWTRAGRRHGRDVNVLVLDLAGLRIVPEPGRLAVLTETLVKLASVPDDDTMTVPERAFLAFDTVLSRAMVAGPSGELARVGLYNPFTGQIAVHGVPDTESFGDGRPIELPREGALAVVADGMLHLPGRPVPQLEPSVSQVLGILSSAGLSPASV